jgi:choline kinase
MGSLTADKPKCLVEVRGKTILDSQLEVFRRSGVSKVTVVSGYRGSQIKRRGVQKKHNPDFATTNMVWTLFNSGVFQESDCDLVVSYGDIVFDLAVLQELRGNKADVSVVVDTDWERLWRERFSDPLSDAETLRMDSSNRLIEIGKKIGTLDEVMGQYIGLTKFSRSFRDSALKIWKRLGRAAEGKSDEFRQMYMTEFIQHLIDADSQVVATPIVGGWMEFDSQADVELYNSKKDDFL